MTIRRYLEDLNSGRDFDLSWTGFERWTFCTFDAATWTEIIARVALFLAAGAVVWLALATPESAGVGNYR